MAASGLHVIVVAGAAIAAAAIDVRTRRVPNALTFTTMLVGLGLATTRVGDLGTGAAIAGGLIGLALMLPGYLFGGTGGGDVKLLAAFGTLLGPAETLQAFLAMALAGGAIAILVWGLRRRAGPSDRSFAYAPAVSMGAIVAVLT